VGLDAGMECRVISRYLIFIFFITGCVTPEEQTPIVDVDVRADIDSVNAVVSYQEMLLSLDKVAPVGSPRGEVVRTPRYILQALAAHEAKDESKATEYWLSALEIADGQFGKWALKEWVLGYNQQLGKKAPSKVMAKLFLAELSRDKRSIPYLKAAKLDQVEAFEAYLVDNIPQWLDDAPEEKANEQDSELTPVAAPVIADVDKLVTTLCGRKLTADELVIELKAKLTGLPLDFQTYGSASLYFCLKDLDKAKGLFTKLNNDPKSSAAVRVSSLRTLTYLYRRVDRRDLVSEYYGKLFAAWERELPSDKTMGLSSEELQLMQVNDYLWAARYRALTGHYQEANEFSRSALRLLNKMNGGAFKRDRSLRKKAYELRAETYHVLASRIAVEKRDFDGAASYAQLGMELIEIDDVWRDRFQWYLGLYSYLGGDFTSAKKYWEKLLASSEDTDTRSKLYYWLAALCVKLNQSEEADFYLNSLNDEFPLSYYNVVGVPQLELKQAKDWRMDFPFASQSGFSFGTSKDFDLSRLRKHKVISPLLLQAELLLLAKVDKKLTEISLAKLVAEVKRTFLIRGEMIPSFVYLSRLQYGSGMYQSAVYTTYQVNDAVQDLWKNWPEQLFLYFPSPFLKTYERSAERFQTPAELLLAITRQESVFKSEARSGADAVGLMQLIEPTARRLAPKVGYEPFGIFKRLQEPEVNVALGAAYLSELTKYYKGFHPAVYAAYNAGEYAVDRWLANRAHSNPLMWVELIPFGETRNYVKKVWRNRQIYQYLRQKQRLLESVGPEKLQVVPVSG